MGLADDEKATAKAARTAQSAADLAERKADGIEMAEVSGSDHPSVPDAGAKSHGRRPTSGTYDISGSLTKETAAAAVKKLADLRGESQKLMNHDHEVLLYNP